MINIHCYSSPKRNGMVCSDLQLVRCPVCDLNTYDGEKNTCEHKALKLEKLVLSKNNADIGYQTLGVFLNEGQLNGSWQNLMTSEGR
ncbi:hypothetical protein Hdeb2414_s0656g00930531 [Helianthus debilis subsp. tardiflorus]